TLAYLLLMLGMLGIAVELTSPGAVAPGVIGAVSLLLSLYAFSILPVNWIGALLMLLGVALLIGEIFVTSFGLLGLVGAAFFVVGSLLLVEAPLPGMAGIGLGVVLPSAVVLAVV